MSLSDYFSPFYGLDFRQGFELEGSTHWRERNKGHATITGGQRHDESDCSNLCMQVLTSNLCMQVLTSHAH